MSQTLARVLGLVLLFVLTISVSAFAAKPVEAPAISDPSVSISGIEWRAFVDYERLSLTISGPNGFTLSREFEAGRPAVLRVGELGAKFPADGEYTWELRVIPRIAPETKRRLAAARKAGDDDAVARIQEEAGLNRDNARSGAFTIHAGSFVTGGDELPSTGRKVNANALKPAPADVVTADDSIVQGSLCVGLDCVNNESFGFDTIRLKENNTRIKFEDTSTSAGFPNNKWQLTANDSASGGANKFSIDDTTNSRTPFTIRAGAPNDSLFISSNGKLGLRNASPVLDIHVTTGDTPAIRQEQTNASGFTAQTWDIGANEANWFVRDVTGGSRLPLRIRPGAPTSSIDVAANGWVGMGTASPGLALDVRGPNATTNTLASFGTGSADNALNMGYAGGIGRGVGFISAVGDGSTVAPNPSLRFFTATNMRMIIDRQGFIGLGGLVTPTNPIEHSNGAFLSVGGAWTNASSRDFKTNICPLDPETAQQTLSGLTAVTYAYKADLEEHHVGFIAEDSPDIVTAKDHRGMSALDVVAVLTKVVQEQQKVIAQLSQRVEQLEKDAHGSQK